MPEDPKPEMTSASGIPTPKQFRASLKEIFDSETTFGSARAARLDLLESALDIIQEYLKHGCRIVYLHGKLKEAGYTGSRKELCEWLVAKGLREKREASGKRKEEIHDSESTENVTPSEESVENNESGNAQSGDPAPGESEGSQSDDSAPENKGNAEVPENQTTEKLEHSPNSGENAQKEKSENAQSGACALDEKGKEAVPDSQPSPGSERTNPAKSHGQTASSSSLKLTKPADKTPSRVVAQVSVQRPAAQQK